MDHDRSALDHLFSLAYEELRRLAGQVRSGGDGETLNPTVLVHEAWLRMAGSPELGQVSTTHFKRIAARAMRQVLVDAARRRKAEKRGGGAVLITFDDSAGDPGALAGTGGTVEEVLALSAALDELATLNPRQASLVEARFFGGLEVRDAARAMDVSEATAHRDWRAARAWLSVRLGEGA